MMITNLTKATIITSFSLLIYCLPGYCSEPPISALLLLLEENSEPPMPACSKQIPPEGPAAGDYRSFSYFTNYSISSVAVSNRGWRCAAGTRGEGLYIFSRDTGPPLTHALKTKTIYDLDISHDGAIVAASSNEGEIFLFSCDGTKPAWSYATVADDNELYPEVEISLSDDGRWLAAASDYHLYLFRWDKSQPVVKLKLSNEERLSSLAISGNGKKIAVATEFGDSDMGKISATLHLLNSKGVIWQTNISSDEAVCTANISTLPIDISYDGSKLAAAGCDDQLRFFDTKSSQPLWQATIGDNEMITSLDMSADGKSLSLTGDTIRYVRNTSTQPDFGSKDNWAFNYWLTYQQPSVYGTLDSWNSPWDGYIGTSPLGGSQNLSMSDNGHYIYAGSYSVSYLLHRDENMVARLFGAPQDVGQAFYAAAISPDGSWVVAGSTYGDEILRFEVAPIQKISTDLPLAVTFPDNPADVVDLFDYFGVDSFNIFYRVLKPGRAASINQEWYMSGINNFGVFTMLDMFCQGDSQWSWTLNLEDGNVEASGNREISPPQCLASEVSAIETYHLFADLEPEDPAAGGVTNLSTDSLPLIKVQVGTGNP